MLLARMMQWGRGGEPFRAAIRAPVPMAAALMIAALLGLLGVGLWDTLAVPPPVKPPVVLTKVHGVWKRPPTDSDFYRKVIADVKAGAPYYPAAVHDQRVGHYPLHPFIAVRPPVLATGLAMLPSESAGRVLLAGLAALTVAAWGWRFVEMRPGKLRLAAAVGLLAVGVVAAFSAGVYPFHEVWAGLLISLSLAHRRPGMWTASVLIGLFAALLRELSAAYLIAMMVLAWKDGCRREATAWAAALGVFFAALGAHAVMVHSLVLPTDAVSQGWLKISGWPFVLDSARWNTILLQTPRWLGALLMPFALMGLAMWRGPVGERVALTVLGYTGAFVFLGRPENAYWGLMIAPLLPLGLLFAPEALLVLGRTAAGLHAARRSAAAYP
jgi:hypothetical protein